MGDHEKNGCKALTCQSLPSESGRSERGREEELSVKAGRHLFSGPCIFVTAAADTSQIPLCHLPEIAFAGRSNVGKSSLINALTGRRALARVSKKPGCTQKIFFFQVSNRLMLVDLPGYGYAAAPKSIVQQWTGLVCSYLRCRQSLRNTLLLIDSRHGIKENDRVMMRLLDKAAVSYQVILSKADKVGLQERTTQLLAVSAEVASHAAACPGVPTISAERQIGVPGLRALLERLVPSV